MIGLYVFGIVMGILMALFFKKTAFKGEAVPFVMELPNYRMPGAKNVVHLLWDKAKDFLQRAFTVIFLATIVIWFLQNFDMGLNMVSDSQNSILAMAARIACADFPACGIWRLADRNGVDLRIFGKRERGVFADSLVRKHSGITGRSDVSRRGVTACILSFVYPMCRCDCFRQTGTWR